MKTLLITAGDSWCDINGTLNYKKYNIKLWPYIISDHMEYDIINIGQAGAGNNVISTNTIDAIYKHFIFSEKYDNCVICVLWSEGKRVNLWNTSHRGIIDFKQIPNDELDHLIWKKENTRVNNYKVAVAVSDWFKQTTVLHYKENERANRVKTFYDDIIENNYRSIFLLDDLCKKNNIKIYHGKSLKTLDTIPNILNISDGMLNQLNLYDYVYNIKYELIDKFEDLYWLNKVKDITNVICGKTIHDVIPFGWDRFNDTEFTFDCNHPNQKGNNEIASHFLNKLTGNKLLSNNYPKSPINVKYDYVYD